VNISSSLVKRVLSAVILAPCFLAAIYYGGLFLQFWLVVAWFLSVYEWYGLSRKTNFFAPCVVLGVVYITLAYGSFLALREVYSINVLVIFLGMIWASDIGAYFVGKIFGGPKLIQSISPNKTWSGFGGALFSPALFAFLWFLFFGLHDVLDHNAWFIMWPIIAVIGITMGSVGQAGDLLVSFIKRQAGVKDTGNLIPGHGGLLDRIDSTLLGAPVFFVMITLLSYVL